MATRRDQGSVTVEATITATALITTISGLLLAGLLAFAKIWIHHASYEAVICLAARESESICRTRMELMVQGPMPMARIRHSALLRQTERARVEIEVSLLPGLSVRETRDLRLPLKARNVRR